MISRMRSPCVCHHSFTAHNVATGGRCAFCTCKQYRQPATAEVEVQPLSDDALRAVELLQRNEGFRDVRREFLTEFVREGRRKLFMDGAMLMQQGQASDCLYVLLRGTVKVEREVNGGVITLAELGPGDVVGEMGVLIGAPRSATVTALEDLETVQLDGPSLKATFEQNAAVLLAIMRLVSERAKTTDELVEMSLSVALTQLS
jgi:CRP-like cAMP-binding protein